MSDATLHAQHSQQSQHAHPGPIEYIQVAIFLAIVTAGEVAVYYLSALKSVLVPTLLVMAIVKFATVVAYFMHLKFDVHVFRRFLIMGIGLAMIVFTVSVAMLSAYK